MEKNFIPDGTNRGPSKASRVAISDHRYGKDVGTEVARGMMETLEVNSKAKKTTKNDKEKAEKDVDGGNEKAAKKNKEKAEKEVDGRSEKATKNVKNNEKALPKKGEVKKDKTDNALVETVMDHGFTPLHTYVLDKLNDFKKSKTFAMLLKDQELGFLFPTKKHKTGKVRLGGVGLDDSDDDFDNGGKLRFGSDDLGDSDDDYGTGHDDRLGDVSADDLYAHVIANKKETYSFQSCFEGFLAGGRDILCCLRWFEAMKKDNTSSEEFMGLFAKIMGVVDGIPDRVLPSGDKQTLKKCHEKLNASKKKEKQKKGEKAEKGMEEKATKNEKNNEKAGAKKGEVGKGGPDKVVNVGAPSALVEKLMNLAFKPLHTYVLDKLDDFKKSKTFAMLLKDQELTFLFPTKKHKTRKVRLGGVGLDDSDDDFDNGGKLRFGSDDLGDSDDDYGTGHDDRLDDVSADDLYAHVIANKKETYSFQSCFEGFLAGGRDILCCLRWFEAMKKDNTSYEEFMGLFAKIIGVVDGIPDRVLPSGDKQTLKTYHDKFKGLDLKAATQKASKKNF